MKKRGLDELRKQYIQEKGYDVTEMYECDWWKKYETDNIVKQHLHQSLPYRMPLGEKNYWRVSNLKVSLVMFDVILKYPRSLEKLLPTF